jgi:tRNA nucleotidyltransferase (CCA-adding enzyme)
MEMNVKDESTISKINKLPNDILTKITPSKQQRADLADAINKIFNKIKDVISKQNLEYKLEPILVGSSAKDTYLINPDIDVFIMFPSTVPVEELRQMGLDLGRLVLPEGEEKYAEHPYISGKFEGYEIDIVPCTPFHTEFIINHLKPNQNDEVRLLKQFMKGIGVYGAEIEVQGYSGYLCELLILKYGTMLTLLKAVKNWPDELVLGLLHLNEIGYKEIPKNPEFQTKSILPKKLKIKFKNEPLVFIDPVDKSRNVASAVGKEKFNLFKIAAEKYLNDPKLEFFFPNSIQPFPLKKLKKELVPQKRPIIGIEFTTPKDVPDVLFGQIRKCQRALEKLLNTEGFNVVHSRYFVNDQTLILFELGTIELPEVQTHTGPPAGHRNVEDFVAKWNTSNLAINKPYLKDDRWYVDIKREFRTPIELLRAKISTLNLGKKITIEIIKNIKIYKDQELVKPGFELALTDFIERKYPWEY